MERISILNASIKRIESSCWWRTKRTAILLGSSSPSTLDSTLRYLVHSDMPFCVYCKQDLVKRIFWAAVRTDSFASSVVCKCYITWRTKQKLFWINEIFFSVSVSMLLCFYFTQHSSQSWLISGMKFLLCRLLLHVEGDIGGVFMLKFRNYFCVNFSVAKRIHLCVSVYECFVFTKCICHCVDSQTVIRIFLINVYHKRIV